MSTSVKKQVQKVFKINISHFKNELRLSTNKLSWLVTPSIHCDIYYLPNQV